MKRKIETPVIEPVKRLKITGSFSGTILEKVTNEDLDNGYFNCPEGITEIGINAFKGCTNLTHVTLPQGITQIGRDAFADCINLTEIILPEGIKKIGESAFKRCINLTRISLPEGIAWVSNDLFHGCTKLTHITLPHGIKQIGQSAFRGCFNLTHIILPQGITDIFAYAFEHCINLTTVMLPNSINLLDLKAFSHCINIKFILLFSGTHEDFLFLRFLLPNDLKNKVVSKSLDSILQWQLYAKAALAQMLVDDAASVIYNKALSFFNPEIEQFLKIKTPSFVYDAKTLNSFKLFFKPENEQVLKIENDITPSNTPGSQ